jgi:predicted hydrocarbon binding protein
VQDICDQIKAARNTVSKYIFQLELEKKVVKKKVGVYFLYFSKERDLIQRGYVIGIIKGMYMSLRRHFPDQESTFKQIGREIGENFQIPLDYARGLTDLDYPTEGIAVKDLFEIFGEVYPYFDIFQTYVNVSLLEINDQGNQATYRFEHSDLLETTDDFIYHFYLISGIIETTLSRALNKTVTCDVVQINLSQNREESFVDISIQTNE